MNRETIVGALTFLIVMVYLLTGNAHNIFEGVVLSVIALSLYNILVKGKWRYQIGNIRKDEMTDGRPVFLVSQTWIAKLKGRPMLVTIEDLTEWEQEKPRRKK